MKKIYSQQLGISGRRLGHEQQECIRSYKDSRSDDANNPGNLSAKSIKFTKMHGLGNDFVIFDATKNELAINPGEARLIADRHRGIGCDHILVLQNTTNSNADFFYRIINADGSEAEFSGNGVRCLAKYIHDKGLIKKNSMVLATSACQTQVCLNDDGSVTVDVGKPFTDPKKIPFLADQEALYYELRVGNDVVKIGAVSVGNPHVVLLVEDVATAPVQQLGEKIENHLQFPERVNVNFMQIVDRNTVKIRVFERGSGETLACGSGSCASVAIGRLWGLVDENVTVQQAGGSLDVCWKDEASSIFLKGPAVKVFDGMIDIGHVCVTAGF